MSKRNAQKLNGMAYSRDEWNEIQRRIKEARYEQHEKFYPEAAKAMYTLVNNEKYSSGF